MTAPDYTYDQGWHSERARLAGIEALWDPGTQTLLQAGGAVSGAHVLEAGAGGGAVVAWLAEQVGADGYVLAVDLDIRFLESLRSATVEVRQAISFSETCPRAPSTWCTAGWCSSTSPNASRS